MKINKIKYNKQEVLDLMGEQKGDYEIILGEQKNVIQRLKADVKRLSAELEAYRNRENLITLTLRSSEEKAEETRRLSELQYAAEVRRLTEFRARWKIYFGALTESYPKEAAAESAALLSRMDEILGGDGSDREKVEKLNLAVGGIRVKFDPKAKIESYLDAAEDETACAFDMNEVLNPGELELEELCKEMGLMEK